MDGRWNELIQKFQKFICMVHETNVIAGNRLSGNDLEDVFTVGINDNGFEFDVL